MPCLKTIVKLMGFLTGCVRGGNTLQSEQVRKLPPFKQRAMQRL
jgi:hypothetical protein